MAASGRAPYIRQPAGTECPIATAGEWRKSNLGATGSSQLIAREPDAGEASISSARTRKSVVFRVSDTLLLPFSIPPKHKRRPESFSSRRSLAIDTVRILINHG